MFFHFALILIRKSRLYPAIQYHFLVVTVFLTTSVVIGSDSFSVTTFLSSLRFSSITALLYELSAIIFCISASLTYTELLFFNKYLFPILMKSFRVIFPIVISSLII